MPGREGDPIDNCRGLGIALGKELTHSFFDVIFAPVASGEVAFLETNLLIVSTCPMDAALSLMGSYSFWAETGKEMLADCGRLFGVARQVRLERRADRG